MNSCIKEYIASGLSALPADRSKKCPSVPTWKAYQERLPSPAECGMWAACVAEGVCVVTGAVSGNLEMIDFDFRAELYPAWRDLVEGHAPGLLGRLYLETSQSGGVHAVYRCAGQVSGNLKLAQRRVPVPGPGEREYCGKTLKAKKDAGGEWHVLATLIETRGEGGLFLCAPTPGYSIIQGDLAGVQTITQDEREILLGCAWSLNEFLDVAKIVRHEGSAKTQRPGDDYNQRGDIRPTLVSHGWTMTRPGENEHWCRPGKSNATSATLRNVNGMRVFYVFSSNADPFEADTAYSQFSAYALLEHGGDYAKAAKDLRAQGFGEDEPAHARVDVASIVDDAPKSAALPDPGPVPIELLRVPGFVSELLDYSVETAPYSNHAMAFCGALAMQAFLAGRKVRTSGDVRTNLYLLGLANSASGKDYPRKVNVKIAYHIGLSGSVGDRFASGEGLEDAMVARPCMLFQTDEIDGMLRSINTARDARHESIMNHLLSMYTSSNSVVTRRAKSKQMGEEETESSINQPCLVLFGTAIPKQYYESLNNRMLGNGLFARMLVVESGKRPEGRDAIIRSIPQRVMEVAKWWADFVPGKGNVSMRSPSPRIVETNDDAAAYLREFRKTSDHEYSLAEALGDEVRIAVWGRVVEQTYKLALLYAISESVEFPRISLAAMTWAVKFVAHQTRRMLYQSQVHVADTAFEMNCLKLKRMIVAAGGEVSHSTILKNMHMSADDLRTIVSTMAERGDVFVEQVATNGRAAKRYKVVH